MTVNAAASHISVPARATHRSVEVDGVKVFYRESLPERSDAPVLLLLHGFPSASHQFRRLIDSLGRHYRLVAPDYPGFGHTRAPDKFTYSFERLADIVEGFIEQLGLTRYAMYLFDFGAPVGFRLALRHPERIAAIISQNGNAYVEGLSDGWNPIRAYWEDASQAKREVLRSMLTPQTTYWQYTQGVPDPARVSPDGYTLDDYYLSREGTAEIQLDLFGDYKSNVALYPEFQRYFRTHKPRFLAVWGRNDPFFLPPGAEAFKRDIPEAQVTFFDTGHFALETHAAEIAEAIRTFLG
jgi:pimeloyl-ACP methyl ester carboxylesterase